jgi:hypothetical protein
MKTVQHTTCGAFQNVIRRLNDNPPSLFSRSYGLILLGATLLAAMPTTSSALTLVANNDVMVDSGVPTANYDGTELLGIRNVRSTQQTFAKFDLAVLPKDSVITQATLRIFVNRVDAPGALTVNTVSADWSERTLTHANAPALVPLPSPPLVVAATNKERYVNYDITALVQEWQANTRPNFGLAITPPVVGTPVKVALDSKESDDTSHPMEIEVALEGLRGEKGDKGDTGAQGLKGDTGRLARKARQECRVSKG